MIHCPSRTKRSHRSLARGQSSGGKIGSPSPYVPSAEESRATSYPYLARMKSAMSSIEPGASGFGGTPGYLNPVSMSAILTYLRDTCRMRSSGSIFCDIGCGEGRAVLAALEACPRCGGAIGFEVDETTLMVARRNHERFLRRAWRGARYTHVQIEDSDRLPPACIVHADLTHMTDLGCVSHAYSFCYGMPADVVPHLFRVAAATESLRYLVLVYKKQRGDAAHELVEMLKNVSPSLHIFVDNKNRSQLRMPAQVVHGVCVRISPKVREILKAASEGVSAVHPTTDLRKCFRRIT